MDRIEFEVQVGIFRKTIRRKLPSNAHECSAKLLERLGQYDPFSVPADFAHQIAVVQELLQLPKWLLLRTDPEDVNRIREKCAWWWTSPEYFEQKFPVVKVAGQWFCGPESRLFNCSFIEFIHTEQALAEWMKTREDHALNRLLATLWRPAKSRKARRAEDYDGDPRRKYNAYMTEVYAHKIGQLPRAKRMALLYFYMGCKHYIVSEFWECFTSPEDEAPAAQSAEDPFMSLLYIITKSALIGDLEKVQAENLYNVLHTYLHLIKQSKPDEYS